MEQWTPGRIEQAVASVQRWLIDAEVWIREELVSWHMALELGLLLSIAIVAAYAHRRLPSLILGFAKPEIMTPWLRLRLRKLAALAGSLIALLLVWLAVAGLQAAGQPAGFARIAGNLLTAWVVIRLIAGILRDSVWTPMISTIIWLVAALAIVGWLQPFLNILDAVAFSIGGFRLSLLNFAYGLGLLLTLIWAATALSRLIDSQLGQLSGVTPAARVLIAKILRIAFITIAILVALTSVGIDFTAVAVFSGAVGVGIGFGLQKVVSNLISGIILLLDRSIKPGDVIEIGDAYGWIDKLGARYVAIITRDGKEYLIPNEDLITQKVINWSYSDRAVRLKVGVGISYRSDVRHAMELILQIVEEMPRVLAKPEPVVRLVGFGDSSVDLELRIWIEDPEQGIVNIASDIRLAIWDIFHENNIEFPYPQRDLHIVSADGLKDIFRINEELKGEGKVG